MGPISFIPRPLLLNLGMSMGRCLTAFLAIVPVQAHAQITTGGFFCTVLDRQDGNPLRYAKVTMESPALFQPRNYTTNQKGEIRAVLLPVGNYRVIISQPGYLSVVLSDLRIGVGSNLSRTLDMALLPGVDRAKAQAGEPPLSGQTAATSDPHGNLEFSKADGGAPDVRLGLISSNRAEMNLELLRTDLRRKVETLASAGLLKGASSECILVLNLSAAGAVNSMKMTGISSKSQEAINARIAAWSFGPQEASVTLRVPVMLGH